MPEAGADGGILCALVQQDRGVAVAQAMRSEFQAMLTQKYRQASAEV